MFEGRSCAIITAGVITLGVICISKSVISYRRKKHLQKIIEEKRVQREENFKKVRQLVKNSTIDAQIVNLDFDVLRSNLQNDVLTPVDVLLAFQAQALKAQDATNCVVEFLLEANQWAEELTQKYQDGENEKPYLYGIPVSLKEMFYVKNHDQTIGFVKNINKPAVYDSYLVAQLKSLGAVPFVLTSVPQSMLSIGSSNPIFGTTTNPRNPEFSSGGSSSGEGALIALRGSPLGFGSDIGGSVRVPAHFCGIYSLMPTTGRLTFHGQKVPGSGFVALKGTAGAMGPSVDALVAFYQSIWPKEENDESMYMMDPTTVPLPFNDHLFFSQSKLTIGYYDDDGFLEPVPACKRAVHEAAKILTDMGHKLVKFQPPEIAKAMSLHFSFMAPDNWVQYLKHFENEIVDEKQNEVVQYMKLGLCTRWHMGVWKKLVTRKPNVRCGFPHFCFFKNVTHHREMCSMLHEYRENFISSMKSAGITCILCPILAGTAQKLDYISKMFFGGWGYSALYNLLDFPAGAVPCTLITADDEKALKDYKATDFISRAVKKGSEGGVGLPVGVQIVSLPYREETCLRVMKDLENGLKTSGAKNFIAYV